MSLKKYIKVYPIIKDPIVLSKFIRFLNKAYKTKMFEQGGLGQINHQDKKIRDVNILSLTNTSASLSVVHWANFIGHFIIKGMREYVKEFPDVQGATIHDMQALRYGLGGHYDFHVDDGPGFQRKYSSILILNNDYVGGQLCFKIDDKVEMIKNVPGNLIIWPSNFMYPHSVKPLTEGTRYSIVTWMN